MATPTRSPRDGESATTTPTVPVSSDSQAQPAPESNDAATAAEAVAHAVADPENHPIRRLERGLED